jgi:hypothetical protein
MQDDLLERAERAIAESSRLMAQLWDARQQAAQHDGSLQHLLKLLRIERSKPPQLSAAAAPRSHLPVD